MPLATPMMRIRMVMARPRKTPVMNLGKNGYVQSEVGIRKKRPTGIPLFCEKPGWSYAANGNFGG
jgi:hypothetical protein